jgi:hypothetical protein
MGRIKVEGSMWLKRGLKKGNGPELGTRGLHSESGGGRGLTAWDAVCVDLILAISDPLVQNFLAETLRVSVNGANGGIAADPAGKGKSPEPGSSGPALRGVGGGRGLTARDAVCIDSILAIKDLFI